MWELLKNPDFLQSALTAGGTVLAAVILSLAGVFGYGRQKKADRKNDLIKRKQEEYERYLLAFRHASEWNLSREERQGLSQEQIDYAEKKHTEALFEYHDAHLTMLLVASDEVVKSANAFHRYYVDSDRLDWRKAKTLYAKMVSAMRKDGFEKTRLSNEEVAEEIPWTIGSELEDRRRETLERAQQQAQREQEAQRSWRARLFRGE